jgi:fatty-acyl-CoA synthase
VTGRKKDLIIVGGHNLYPHEIEDALHALEQIKPGRVVAFAVFDDNLGTEELVVAAELKPGSAVSSALKEEIRRLISAQFDVTPIDICLFSARVLAKSTSGKISRARCREQYVAGSLGQADPET